MNLTPRLEREAERSPAIRNALALTREAHAGQTRKVGGEETPFVEHPLAVAELLAEEELDEEVVAAGLLHDVLERSAVEPPQIESRVGGRVARLVEALTEDESIARYERRKRRLRECVAAAGRDAAAVFAADKLANVEALRAAYRREGEEIDAELPVPLDLKIYVWELDLEMLFQELPDLPLVERLASAMVGLWRDRVAKLRGAQRPAP